VCVCVCVCVWACVGVQNIADPSLVEDPAKDKQFAEPAIDTMRVQKDEVPVLQLCRLQHNFLKLLLVHYKTRQFTFSDESVKS